MKSNRQEHLRNSFNTHHIPHDCAASNYSDSVSAQQISMRSLGHFVHLLIFTDTNAEYSSK